MRGRVRALDARVQPILGRPAGLFLSFGKKLL
jgi:hypothetical protein